MREFRIENCYSSLNADLLKPKVDMCIFGDTVESIKKQIYDESEDLVFKCVPLLAIGDENKAARFFSSKLNSSILAYRVCSYAIYKREMERRKQPNLFKLECEGEENGK